MAGYAFWDVPELAPPGGPRCDYARPDWNGATTRCIAVPHPEDDGHLVDTANGDRLHEWVARPPWFTRAG